MEKQFNTPKEVLQHIADVYSECNTFREIHRKGLDEFICVSVENICGSNNLQKETSQIIKNSFQLSKVGNDLELDHFAFWNTTRASDQNREKECIQLKVDFLNKVIETL